MNATTVEAARFGISPHAQGANNDRRLREAIATVDAGTAITFRPETYLFDCGVPILRGEITVQGAGMDATVFEYTSAHDGYIGTGTVITIGSEHVPADPIDRVTLRDFTCRDLRRELLPEFGHNPSAIDALWVDDFLAQRLGFENIKGNACLTLLGYQRDNLTPVSHRATIQGCRCTGTESGGWIQGDGINAAGVHDLVLRQNSTSGGILRHFLEGGSAVHVLTVDGNAADMRGHGKSCLGSFTVVERGTVTRNRFDGWGAEASAIAVEPDLVQGQPLLPVVNITMSFNSFTSKYSGLAAIALNDGMLGNHRYVRNNFHCLLPFSIQKQPTSLLEISDNDAYWDTEGGVLVRIGAAGDPIAPVSIVGNRLHGHGARVVDRPDWTRHSSVRGLETNRITSD